MYVLLHSCNDRLSVDIQVLLVTELMSPSKQLERTKSEITNSSPASKAAGAITVFTGRDGLGAYLASPEQFPPSRVLYHNEDFVAIHDLYPKSSVHILLLPRHPSAKLHPFDAFESDPKLLEKTKEEVEKVRKMVAAELRRRFGHYSRKEQTRVNAMERAEHGPDGTFPSLESLPVGRDWEAEVVAGVHSGPSMNHLHVHVLSRDRMSECLRHRKHYNSFATPFMVRLDELPLDEADVRRRPSRGGYLRNDLKCWRCGRNFRNRFQELKKHLSEEFEEWRAE